MKRAFAIATLVLTAALPWSAAASVSVIDVMYDAPGSDTRREWVEFSTDTAITDIRTWRFLEGGVRHKIVGESGAVLANTRFVLAADIPSFRVDNPEYSGLVFDTAMSLANSGETFSLIDASGATVVTHSYVPKPKPVDEKPATSVKKETTQKAEPRVLGAATSAVRERGTQVAAAIESTSPEWAWFSFSFLGFILLLGIGGLMYVQFRK